MNNEPSVLDYVKSRLSPGRYAKVEIPPEGPAAPADGEAAMPALDAAYAEQNAPAVTTQEPRVVVERRDVIRLWLMAASLLLAMLGQAVLRPNDGSGGLLGAGLLGAGAGLAMLALFLGREHDPAVSAVEITPPPVVQWPGVLLGLGLALLGFLIGLTGKPPVFTPAVLTFVLGGLFLLIRGLWLPTSDAAGLRERLRQLIERRSLTLTLDLPALAGLAAVIGVLFVRLYRLGQIPPEMNSDHAEKLLDILRVLNGEHLIFFPTNGGREALIFYLGAALHRLAGIALGFDLLKIGSALIGMASLPFIYKLGVELGGRRVGALAFFLAGIAYWPNVVSRFGLRLPFYFLFTAAVLFYTLRGLRQARRNDFIWAGLWLGLGFYGYTPNRLLPLMVLVAFGLYLLHHRDRNRLRFGLLGLLIVALVSLVVIAPLLSYIIVEPEAFLARTLTRVGDAEQPLSAGPLATFIDNFGRALRMFSRDAGEIWPVSIPHSPALGMVTGALFYLGAALLGLRYVMRRGWTDLLLLLSIPLLLLPSVLSLAFPAENPNLYRTGGVIVPVFLMAATALDGLMQAVERGLGGRSGLRWAWAAALLVLGVATIQESGWVFVKYYEQYRNAAWNTREVGRIAGEFAATIGTPDTIWVMGYPHWLDSRLVAVNAGFPGRDYRMFPENLEATQQAGAAKLFFLHPNDITGAEALRRMYPQGWLSTYTSATPTKDFKIFFVPALQEP